MGDVRHFRRVGGHLALDFVNTLGGDKRTADDEYLFGYADLLAWSAAGGLIDAATAGRLERAARRRPAAAGAALAAALGLRGALDAVLRARLAGRPPRAADVDAVRAAAVDALGHARLEPGPDGFAWVWRGAALARPLWPVAHAAVGLLRSGDLDRLAECGHCRWLFLDHSRNRSRRWCSMNACGGREKMRRHRAKGS
jgi:predicted RNA-binding Zn ribbon-like protein